VRILLFSSRKSQNVCVLEPKTGIEPVTY
jgi:hypothetical protein